MYIFGIMTSGGKRDSFSEDEDLKERLFTEVSHLDPDDQEIARGT